MIRSLRSEALKVTTTRIWWVLGLVLFGYVGITAGGMAALFSAEVPTGGQPIPQAAVPSLVYSLATSVGYVFPILFGALAATGEFRHQTLTPTFLATPRRSVVLGAKSLVSAGWGAVYGLVGLLAAAGIGALVLAAMGHATLLDESDTWAMLGRSLLAMTLWSVIGTGLGVLVRNQVVVIVTVLAFTQFVQPLLIMAGTFWEWSAAIVRFLPGAASDALVGASIFSIAEGGAMDPLEWWQGGLVLGGYAVLFLVLGGLTTWRRDVT